MFSAILDTNLLIAYANKADSLHEHARLEIRRLAHERKTFIVPKLVATEVIVANSSPKEALEFCLSFGGQLQECTFADLKALDSVPLTLRRSLKATDSLILVMAQRLNAELVTFDVKLQKAASLLGLKGRD